MLRPVNMSSIAESTAIPFATAISAFKTVASLAASITAIAVAVEVAVAVAAASCVIPSCNAS